MMGSAGFQQFNELVAKIEQSHRVLPKRQRFQLAALRRAAVAQDVLGDWAVLIERAFELWETGLGIDPPPGRALTIGTTKTARFLTSFQAVERLPEHCNYGDETPALRDLGMAPSIATALIRWGEQHCLVCTFESAAGCSNNAYSWKPEFLRAAALKHIELFGAQGLNDLPPEFLRRFGPDTPVSEYELERAEQAATRRTEEAPR